MRFLLVLPFFLSFATSAWATSAVCPKAFDGAAQQPSGGSPSASDLALLGAKTRYWTGDIKLGAEAILSAREFGIFYQKSNPILEMPWVLDNEDYSVFSTAQPEVRDAINGYLDPDPRGYRRQQKGASVDLNLLLRNYAAQVSNPYQLGAYRAVMKVEKKSNLSYLVDKSRTPDGASSEQGESGLRIADITSRLHAALAVSSPEMLKSFERMNQAAGTPQFTHRTSDSSYTSGHARPYTTNVQRYLSYFADHPEDHEILAALMEDGIPWDRTIEPNPHRFGNPYAVRAWNIADIALGADEVLVDRIDFARIESEAQFRAIEATWKDVQGRREKDWTVRIPPEQILREMQEALQNVPAPAPAPAAAEAPRASAATTASSASAGAAAPAPAPAAPAEGWFTRFRGWLNGASQ